MIASEDILTHAMATMALEGVPEAPSEFLELWRTSDGGPTGLNRVVSRLREAESAGARGSLALRAVGLQIPTRAGAARHLIRVCMDAVVAGRADPIDAASFVLATLLPELERVEGRMFASPMRVLPNAVGSACGLEFVLCWLREIWDCRSGAQCSIHCDLPRAELERRLVGYLRTSIDDWVSAREAS